jgi:glycerophosphoryl diester phosphodiesterase
LGDLISTAQELGAAAIHPRKDIATPAVIQAARQANLRINVWTVNNPTEVSLFRSMGVDGIFSDFPERCLTSAS